MTLSCNLPLCIKINKRSTKISFGRIPRKRLIPQTEEIKPEREYILKKRTKSPIETQSPQKGMVWPLSGKITSLYGWRRGRHHDGIDIAARMGKPIVAAANGTVIFSGWRSGYGRMVVIQHNRWLKTIYGHTSRNYVRRGEKVTQGQVIALVGSTGRSTGPHLHFEVRNTLGAQNPMNYLA
jgi:murein DD-endopeptidase MepM/ murein hydrolase activator NlpD